VVRVVARVAMCPCHDIKLEACVEFLWGENRFFYVATDRRAKRALALALACTTLPQFPSPPPSFASRYVEGPNPYDYH